MAIGLGKQPGAQLVHQEGDLAFHGRTAVAVLAAEAEQVGAAGAGPLAEAVGTGGAAGVGVEAALFFNVGHDAAGGGRAQAFLDEGGIDFVFVAGGKRRDHAEDHRRKHQDHTKQDFQFTHILMLLSKGVSLLCVLCAMRLYFVFVWVARGQALYLLHKNLGRALCKTPFVGA